MKLALCLIVKGTDQEAKYLDRCLTNLKGIPDGIFITRTSFAGEILNEAVAAVCKKHKAHLSDFIWVHDFAKARNFNFSQVPKEFDYIMWCDADDIWKNQKLIKPTIKDNPGADAFGFWYLYDWDETRKPVVVHRKTMIVKNENVATWVGAIHEDLIPNRAVDVKLVEGIQRLHLSSETRAQDNAKRNLEIAKNSLKENINDPVSHWNLANSFMGVSEFAKARDSYQEFIELSKSKEEVYLARMRLGAVYKAIGENSKCIQELQTAIGIDPTLPDAYFVLAQSYFDFSDMDNAEQYCLQGLVKRPQVMKMVVYNPRDYDYNPMMLLAKIYDRKSRPDLALPLLKGCLKIYPDDILLKGYVKEQEKQKDELGKALKLVQKLQKITDKAKLAKALAKVPKDLQSHPAIAVIRNNNFIKETSSGRDLVIYCGNTIEQWNPEIFKTKMVGGSEEAVIQNARELAKLGWNVTVYNNCGYKPMESDGVSYKPFWEFNYRDKQDVIIGWRWAKLLDIELNAPKIFLDLHDVVSPGELTEKRVNRVTKIFVKSKFHRSLFPKVADDKFVIVGNGVEVFTDKTIEKDPMLMINTSSPDRSCAVLPRIFKEIKKQFPPAKLSWAYGWEGFTNAHSKDAKMMKWMKDLQKEMDEAGIETLGRIPQKEVGELYQKAAIFLYPTEFAEIDCISVKKAQKAGCLAITTDFAALGERNITGYKVHSQKDKDTWAKPYQFQFAIEDEAQIKKFADTCVDMLRLKTKPVPYQVKDSWKEVAEVWNKEML